MNLDSRISPGYDFDTIHEAGRKLREILKRDRAESAVDVGAEDYVVRSVIEAMSEREYKNCCPDCGSTNVRIVDWPKDKPVEVMKCDACGYSWDEEKEEDLGRQVKYRIERFAQLKALPAIKTPVREGWITSLLLAEGTERARQSLEECKQKYPGRYRIVQVEIIETVIEDSR